MNGLLKNGLASLSVSACALVGMCAIVGGSFVLLPVDAQATLITNGSFESHPNQADGGSAFLTVGGSEIGGIANWGTTGFGQNGFADGWTATNRAWYVEYDPGFAPDGNFAYRISPDAGSGFGNGAVTQTGINLIAGRTYTLSFSGWGEGQLGTRALEYSIDTLSGSHVLSLSGTADLISDSFVASSTGSFALTIGGNDASTDNNSIFYVDDVVLLVAPVPEPASAFLVIGMGMAGLGVCSWKKRSSKKVESSST